MLLLAASCAQILDDNSAGRPATTPDGTTILPQYRAPVPVSEEQPAEPAAEDRRSEPSSDSPYDPYGGLVIEEAGCTPPPGGEPTTLMPPAVPPEGGWCYVVQTVDGRYTYAAAITQAQQHHEDLYFGDTPVDATPPPMLHLSCTYIPLMSWGWMDDDPSDPDAYSYYIEYYFVPRVAYDRYLDEGLWGLLDMVGWQLDATSFGEDFRIDWSQERWNPPHENSPVWVSPADTAGYLGWFAEPVFQHWRTDFQQGCFSWHGRTVQPHGRISIHDVPVGASRNIRLQRCATIHAGAVR